MIYPFASEGDFATEGDFTMLNYADRRMLHCSCEGSNYCRIKFQYA